MKRTPSLLYNLLIDFFILACISIPLFPNQNLDRIVAVVEDKIILESELEAYAQLFFSERKKAGEIQSENVVTESFKTQVLEMMINEEVLLAEAREESIVVDQARVEALLKQQVDQFIYQAGSKGQLENLLLEQGLTFAQLKNKLRKQLEEQYLKQVLQEKIKTKIQISKLVVEQFYQKYRDSLPIQGESVHLSHLMIKITPSQNREEEVLNKIKEIEAESRQGKDFGELAKKFSEDPSTKEGGGDLGFFRRGDMVREFETAAFILKENEISHPIKTQYGYHLIQLIERKGESIRARHILLGVAPSENEEKETEKLAFSARQDIARGLDLAQVIDRLKKEKRAEAEGGTLGWIQVQDLDPRYKSVIDTLKVGNVSDPFKIEKAFHLFRLSQRLPQRTLNLEEDWEKISNAATNEEIRIRFQKKLEEWRKKFYVNIRL